MPMYWFATRNSQLATSYHGLELHPPAPDRLRLRQPGLAVGAAGPAHDLWLGGGGGFRAGPDRRCLDEAAELSRVCRLHRLVNPRSDSPAADATGPADVPAASPGPRVSAGNPSGT